MRRLLYIEDKSQGLVGPGWISWVTCSQSLRSVHWRGRTLRRCVGFKWNAIDVATGEHCWISGPKRRGGDRLYGGIVEIDEDARVAYWTEIRGQPHRVREARVRS